MQQPLIIIVIHAIVAGEVPAGQGLLPLSQQPGGRVVALLIRVGIEALLPQLLVGGHPLRQLIVNEAGLTAAPKAREGIGAGHQHIIGLGLPGQQGGGVALGQCEASERHQGHDAIPLVAQMKGVILGGFAQDLLLQRQRPLQGTGGERGILGLGHVAQQADRFIMIQPEPVDWGKQGGMPAHQIRCRRTSPETHRDAIKGQQLLRVIGVLLQPLLAGQHLPHGILLPTRTIDAGIQNGLIAAKTRLIVAGRLTGQGQIALIAGAQVETEPGVAVVRRPPLQNTVITDGEGIAALIPRHPGQSFERGIGGGFEFAWLAAGQRRNRIIAPELHRDEIVEHLAILAAPIEGIQTCCGAIQLPLPRQDDPGLSFLIISTRLDQAGQQCEEVNNTIHSQHTPRFRGLDHGESR
ncbi:hypothetical protein D3C85_877190 [compost metagenome]